MSDVKDLLLIFFFITTFISYISIYRNGIKQRKFFIDTLSHDLRVATIAQIRGLELLEKQLSQDRNEDLIREISNSSKFSLDMINMLLSAYKYENGEQILSYESFFVHDMLASINEHIISLSKQKNINICCNFEAKSMINADKKELEKVINTLLFIAIANAKTYSSVYLFSKNVKNNVEFSILFNGKSLSDEEYRRMFSKNSRFSTVGHGIKLLFCKKIIDFHKGKIFVKQHEGDINSINFTIPDRRNAFSLGLPVSSLLQPLNL